jgi:CDP-glucose 4,6-dehydratase
MFKEIYKNKKVLITGNTGFKGSWLTAWLIKLGANIIGIAKDIPTNPSIFEELKLEDQIKHYKEDVRDLSKMINVISKEKPDFIFHLAAQPLVLTSYNDPIETISSNVMGTANILESMKNLNNKCTSIIVTSDKAYDNIEQVKGYKEDDRLGGKDIYSGSKGAAELIIKSYYYSFLKSNNSNLKIAIARAGNVIGGGDWAKDRIVVDCMKAWSEGKIAEIRSPNATRPWQHVLEPLSGYLHLGAELYVNDDLNGEPFNFGPDTKQNPTVEKLIIDLSKYWGFENRNNAYKITNNTIFHEAKLLKLNCDKALSKLKWNANLNYKDTVKFTSEWYYDFYKKDKKIFDKTVEQITEYENMAKEKALKWTE